MTPSPDRVLRLSELLGSLSYALDLTEGQPKGHCVRASWIGVATGRRLGLDAAKLGDLYYTILLKDLGCSSNAARICQLYLSDDLAFKRDFKEIGTALPQVLRFVLSHTGLKAGMTERFRAIVNILQNGGAIARELIETRCDRGSAIARRMRFSEAVADGIRSLDEHWNGGGKPDGLAGPTIPRASQIALLAQVADVFHTSAGPDGARAEVRARAGSWFDPAVVAAFEAEAAGPGLWADLADPNLPARLFALEPGQRAHRLDEGGLDDVASAFAEVIDAKSPFTSGHSTRVALVADLMAAELGITPERRRWLRRGALLHDIGKLGVSNAILDKPGKLDDAEWVAMRSHAALGEAILEPIAAFDGIAALAGAHHERLDGKGYPRGLTGAAIDGETRIVTIADIFDALTAERPYRGAMPLGRALAILRQDVGTAVDGECLAALERSLSRLGEAEPDLGRLDETQPIPAALFDHVATRTLRETA